MKDKKPIKAKPLDFMLASQGEICKALGQRLKIHRLARNMKQKELASRSGVSVGTVKNLESKGQSTLDTFVRIVMVLDLTHELNPLFQYQPHTIAQMETLEKIMAKKFRKRAR